MKLKQMKPGDEGRITGYSNNDHDFRSRLLILGATPGVPFRVLRVAPLGDPIEISVRGSCISVRKGEIEIMDVEQIK